MVRAPERKVTRNGIPLGVVTVAVNRRFKDQSGQLREEVAFVPCIVFGQQVDWLIGHRKGTLVIVTGRLRTESWEDDNGIQSKLVLVVENIQFVQTIRRPEVAVAQKGMPPEQNGDDDQPPF
jgi:single-strand DNA-binding protein